MNLFLGLIIFGLNFFVQLEALIAEGGSRDVFDVVSPLGFVMIVSLPFLGAAWIYWRAGIELTGSGLTVRLFSTRVIPWGEVADIATTMVRGGRRAQVRLRTGRFLQLPAPRDQGVFRDRGFDDKFEEIYRAWAAYRRAR